MSSIKPANTKSAKSGSSSKEDTLYQVQAQANDVKMVLHDNLHKSLDRQEQLDSIESKLPELEDSVKGFYDGSRRLNWKMKCQYYKVHLLIIVILILLILFLYFALK